VVVSRPIGGILSSDPRESHLCDHPSERPTRDHKTGSLISAWPCSERGLQAVRVTPNAGALLPHLFTLACGRLPGPSAVCFLLHFPSPHDAWLSASTLPCGVPTFLDMITICDRRHAAVTRPTHHVGQFNGPPGRNHNWLFE
jgi:hypothetical protein